MKDPTKVVQVGLGPIGLEMARRAVARPDLDLVGGLDIDASLKGRAMSEILGFEEASAGFVVDSVAEAKARFAPEVALITTTSDLVDVVPLAAAFLEQGIAVVSTCEEMLYPFLSQPEAARVLDEAGQKGGAACLGTGINPGFVLDYLPIALTGPVDRINSVRGWRVVDAASRRGPLQRKVGAGLSEEEFAARVAAGGFGHRGMEETLHMVCAALGVDPDGSTTFIKPVISDRDIETEFVSVKAGQVAGIHQGAEDAQGIVILDLKMYVGARDPGDRVEIEGEPCVIVQVEGGYHGDVATCAVALNAVASIVEARPGLRTMLDVPVVRSRISA